MTDQDGICWVYRYYSLGPAAINWLPDGTPITSASEGGAGGGGKGKGAADEPEGSSWTWFYPYSYAPLMQVGWGLEKGWWRSQHFSSLHHTRTPSPPLNTSTRNRPTTHPHYPPHHPQDLAKPASAASRAGKRTLQAAPIPLTRALGDPGGCPVAAWAPRNGPVRPLLQVCGRAGSVLVLLCS